MVTCPVSFLAVESPAVSTLMRWTVRNCEGLRFDPSKPQDFWVRDKGRQH